MKPKQLTVLRNKGKGIPTPSESESEKKTIDSSKSQSDIAFLIAYGPIGVKIAFAFVR